MLGVACHSITIVTLFYAWRHCILLNKHGHVRLRLVDVVYRLISIDPCDTWRVISIASWASSCYTTLDRHFALLKECPRACYAWLRLCISWWVSIFLVLCLISIVCPSIKISMLFFTNIDAPCLTLSRYCGSLEVCWDITLHLIENVHCLTSV